MLQGVCVCVGGGVTKEQVSTKVSYSNQSITAKQQSDMFTDCRRSISSAVIPGSKRPESHEVMEKVIYSFLFFLKP